MKRHGPPVGSRPSADWKLRAVGEPPHIRSDPGRATSTSPPLPTERTTAPPASADAPTRLEIIALAIQTMPEVPVARHHGADHDAGPLGVWRKVRIREDRGPPRLVPWEPFPSRRVRGAERDIVAGSRGSHNAVAATSKPPGTRESVVCGTNEEIAAREAVS